MKDAPEGEVRIVADRLTKRFGDFVAVNEVSFEAPRGEIMGFLGPNGAGKSTIIRILCGLLRPSDGRAEVAGVDVARYPERVRENIGYMSQKFSLYSDLSVVENLRFFGGVYGVKGERLAKRLAFAIDMAGLNGREGALVADLSGGWKQRLALGCAVLHEPAILFLDEPTSGVDPTSRRRFWDLIHTLAAEGVMRGRHHPLHGRSRILQSDRSHQRRQARGARQPERTEAQRHPRRNPARRRRRSRRDGGSARGARQQRATSRRLAPRCTLWSTTRRAIRRRLRPRSGRAASGGRASSRSRRHSKTYSCSSSAATRAGAPHEPQARQGDRKEGANPGCA